jgi:hypothetical protein
MVPHLSGENQTHFSVDFDAERDRWKFKACGSEPYM